MNSENFETCAEIVYSISEVKAVMENLIVNDIYLGFYPAERDKIPKHFLLNATTD